MVELWIHLPWVTGPGAGGEMPRRREDVERSVAEPLLAAAGAPEQGVYRIRAQSSSPLAGAAGDCEPPSAGRTPVESLESQCPSLFLYTN